MPRRRPPARLSVSNAIFLIFLSLPLLAVAQQQQPSRAHQARKQAEAHTHAHAHAANAHAQARPRAPDANAVLDSLDTPKNGKDTFVIPSNERALATLAPAHAAVRAAPARSSAQSAGLSSRHPARSLQDWQVEDIILLATVDGKIHARDRKTGAAKWMLEADRPMVETTYHRNKSNPGLPEDSDFIWIVEPTQDGSLYVYNPGSSAGVQKTGLSVRQLVEELSPYAAEDPPVVYTADKKNTLLTIDAATGHILKSFSPAGTVSNDDRSCKRVNPMESLDDEECESIGTLTLGRTEYTVAIQDKSTGDSICTIRYFEWTANNRDRDLHDQYGKTMDNKYIYVQHNGGVFAVDHGHSAGVDAPITFQHKFSSPVARVFDVVRPTPAEPPADTSNDAALVLLPQPIGPAGGDVFSEDKIFVNCTESGSWYAMSEKMYPTVTDGASNAVCYTDSLNDDAFIDVTSLSKQRAKLVGIHPLSPVTDEKQTIFTIGNTNDYPTIGAGSLDGANETHVAIYQKRDWAGNLFMAILAVFAVFGLVGVVGQVPMAKKIVLPWLRALNKAAQDMPQKPDLPAAQAQPDVIQRPTTPPPKPAPAAEVKVRYPEPAEETIFAKDEDSESDKASSEEANINETPKPAKPAQVDAQSQENGTPTKPKKKATRGVRGGRKTKEKRQEQLGKQQKGRQDSGNEKEAEKEIESPKAADIVAQAGTTVTTISPEVSESPNASGPFRINKLTLDMDRVIGHGSAGTCVYRGSFEGQDVAVKRMLSQYYELAMSEVTFLHASGYHRNVIRYFCQEKDPHFLYIAVELCQASLWDLYFSDSKDEQKRRQMDKLLASIQKDAPKALHQLAAGLEHLHSLRIIHRDIKPQNILIAYPRRNELNSEPRLVISDFGLCKTLPENMSTILDPTSSAGTTGWKAPELIAQPEPHGSSSNNGHSHVSQKRDSDSSTSNGQVQGVKRAADIFSLGCLFFWVLTGGSHPFDDAEGWTAIRELNIKKNKMQNMNKLDLGSDTEEPMQLITEMLSHSPEDRPTAKQVKEHPFFWSPEKRLAFLCDVSDHFEREPRDPPSEHLEILESWGPDVIPRGDFLKKLDQKFIDTLGKQRKYTGSRMLDLLRALRNKKNHYEDMPDDVKKRVGSLPRGYLTYWTSRFPKLLMACYWIIRDCGVDTSDRFKGYYHPAEV